MDVAFVPLVPWRPNTRTACAGGRIARSTFIGANTVNTVRKRRRRMMKIEIIDSEDRRRRAAKTVHANTARDETVGDDGGNGNENPVENEMEEWYGAIEAVFTEALISYYEFAPLYSDAEFNALRDEVDHLASAQMRLGRVENVWMSATSARDFDRRMQNELDMSTAEYEALKAKIIAKNPHIMKKNKPRNRNDIRSILPSARKALLGSSDDDSNNSNSNINSNINSNGNSNSSSNNSSSDPSNGRDAQQIKWKESDSRLKWFLFGDATEEKLKVAMLYFPAVLMCLVAISLLTILFANLDGEMRISVSHKGQVRLGVLTYIAIASTAYLSDKITPIIMEYLDLGQPTLLRGECPNCGSNISCLFTGQNRSRDERKCKVCGATVGFNRNYSKVFLVDSPGSGKKKYRSPD